MTKSSGNVRLRDVRRLVVEQMVRRNSRGAGELVDAALSRHPRNVGLLSLRASVYESIGKDRDAARVLTQAIKTDPHSADLQLEMVELLADGRRWGTADRYATRLARRIKAGEVKWRRPHGFEDFIEVRARIYQHMIGPHAAIRILAWGIYRRPRSAALIEEMKVRLCRKDRTRARK